MILVGKSIILDVNWYGLGSGYLTLFSVMDKRSSMCCRIIY